MLIQVLWAMLLLPAAAQSINVAGAAKANVSVPMVLITQMQGQGLQGAGQGLNLSLDLRVHSSLLIPKVLSRPASLPQNQTKQSVGNPLASDHAPAMRSVETLREAGEEKKLESALPRFYENEQNKSGAEDVSSVDVSVDYAHRKLTVNKVGDISRAKTSIVRNPIIKDLKLDRVYDSTA